MYKVIAARLRANQFCFRIRAAKADCLILIAISLAPAFSMDILARQLPSESDQRPSDAAMMQATERLLGVGEPKKLAESKRLLPKVHAMAREGRSQALYLIGEMFSRGLKGFTKKTNKRGCVGH